MTHAGESGRAERPAPSVPARAKRAPGVTPASGRLSGFDPVLDDGCTALVLGSFPSEASLLAGHYYAHPRNQFWPILSEILGEALVSLPFEARYRRLLAHHVGIWDVLAGCEREGSLDGSIRRAAANDFERLARLAPRLKRVLFNGRTAARFEPAFRRAGYETRVLPSTSPANAGMSRDRKLEAWRTAFGNAACGGASCECGASGPAAAAESTR